MSLEEAAIAANRFGLGARPGELAAIAGDPRGWLKAQLKPEPALPAPMQRLPTTAAAAGDFAKWLVGLLGSQRGDLARLYQNGQPGAHPGANMAGAGMAGASPGAASMAGAAPDGMAPGARNAMASGAQPPLSVEQSYVRYFGPGYADAVQARFETAVTSERPFFERLSRFWANHFTVSAAKAEIIALVPVFERDVVRPNVTGKFEDMLLASCRHPAMLEYLDNYLSIGPDSPLAHHQEYLPKFLQGRMTGLNENLGREILELHTLGVRSGYTQADVTTLAMIITGWSVYGPNQAPGKDLFHYIDFAHQPGEQVLLGVTYGALGELQGRLALKNLARHPATARRLATKLARHFIADDPPPAAVDRVAAAYTASGGNLGATAAALVDSPEAWTAPPTKLKTPDDYLVSTVRALGGHPDLKGLQLVALLDRMGQRPYWPPGPDGWPDIQDGWIAADAVWKRLEWASTLAQGFATANIDPATLAEATLGPQLSEATRSAIHAADSPAQGLALFLVSPDFQRR